MSSIKINDTYLTLIHLYTYFVDITDILNYYFIYNGDRHWNALETFLV